MRNPIGNIFAATIIVCSWASTTTAEANRSPTLAKSVFFCDEPSFSFEERLNGLVSDGWVEVPFESRADAVQSFTNFEALLLHADQKNLFGSTILYEQSASKILTISQLSSKRFLNGTRFRSAWLTRQADENPEFLVVAFSHSTMPSSQSSSGTETNCTFALVGQEALLPLLSIGRFGEFSGTYDSVLGGRSTYLRPTQQATDVVFLQADFFESFFGVTPQNLTFFHMSSVTSATN